jgi:hypothetical protein
VEFDVEQAMAILSRTPSVFSALLRDLADPWVLSNEGEESWSPFDVLGHLIHGERSDWITRAGVILEHGEAETFEPFDRFAQFAESKGKSLVDLLSEFAITRSASLATLREWNLTPADLERRGRHPEFGVVTLRQLLSTWVAHDLGHIAQAARVMAKQYGAEVGPWSAYLPILAPRARSA